MELVEIVTMELAPKYNAKLVEPKQVCCLGEPIPLDEHAVSVSMPQWKDIIGYETGDVETRNALLCGYPRFFINPYVKNLCEAWKSKSKSISADEEVFALPNMEVAERFSEFITNNNTKVKVNVEDIGACNIIIVSFTKELFSKAKLFWQHTGEIVSSRQAQEAAELLGLDIEAISSITKTFSTDNKSVCMHPCTSKNKNANFELKKRIGTITNQSWEQVFLTACGMAAIFTSFRLVKHIFPQKKICVFGFPYLDTLKIMSRNEWNPAGVIFLGHGDETDLRKLENLLENGEQIGAVFTEFPSNPLLKCPPVTKLSKLSKQHNFLLVIDDTIGNFHNIDLMKSDKGGDILVSSLTKLFNGNGDAMGGSIVLNKCSPFLKKMEHTMSEIYKNETIFDSDAQAILFNSMNFEDRSSKINQTTEKLVDWILKRPEVKETYYPKLNNLDIYKSFQNPTALGSGYGGLFSIVLDDGYSAAKFYDSLQVRKGPSLGTNFTLVCPYTLLAHFDELDFASKYGVDPNLIRISIGLEDYDDLENKFIDAFSASARKE